MSTREPDELSAGDNQKSLLRTVALVAVVIGAIGSFGLMLLGGHPPLLLRILFAIWVLSPFAALLLADNLSKRWSAITRMTLYIVMLIIPLGSLSLYGDTVLRPPKTTPAFMFVVVPFGSWLFMISTLLIAALVSGRLSRRVTGD